ncbi:MAG: nucleoside-diphosphate sugar epimerase [Acidobacteriales bacterium]|nr:nucleoside-diphosphate sugar epimerase [Terriglobales bacterium]
MPNWIRQTLVHFGTTLKPRLIELRGYRKGIILLSHICLLVITYFGSIFLRFDFIVPSSDQITFLYYLPIVVAIKLPLFYYFNLLRGWWRYAGMSDLADITKAALVSALLIYFFRPASFPGSVVILDMMLTILMVAGARFAVRAYTEHVQKSAAQRNTIIVGAGSAGSSIVAELKRNPDLDYKPIGFVDDDPTKLGISIHGVRVLAKTETLPKLIANGNVQCVLFAIPSATGKKIEQIVTDCRDCNVELKILPSVSERIKGRSPVSQVRNIQLEDLLGRAPVVLDVNTIRAKFAGKVLLITGAGGSIGSELVRQLAKFSPRRLLLFDRSENDLFKISVEMSIRFPEIDCMPVIGDIQDVAHLRQVFASQRPDSVFHAAAYKHVPLMEMNCFQAITNNIFGTYNVAVIAKEYSVRDFVLISSDKAVNPTNIMGVSKRIAELIVLSLQKSQHTRFTAVRFGNVLGSNGSVVPTFQQQIESGGPITVTSADAKRYFMTIPEAVQLVLQASTMGQGGEIFVLDMGEPVRILDLAENLVRLSGLEPGRDIKIVFTGLRPGEKLVEQLRLAEEQLGATAHDKIRVLKGESKLFGQVLESLHDLSALVEAKNINALVTKLKEIVPEYLPSEEIRCLCELDRHHLAFNTKRVLEPMVMRNANGVGVVATDKATEAA